MRTIKLTVLLLALIGIAPLSAQPISKNTWQFDVFLNDTKIGFHHFDVVEQNEQKLVYSKARFDVEFLFFTAYQYEHDNFEIWKDNCLIKIQSYTNDNGEQYQVSGQAVDNQFLLSALDNNKTLPNCVKTFSYWDPDFLNASRLLNPQTGNYTNVTITRLADASVTVAGNEIKARRYKLTGDKLEIYLWYSERNHWLALESVVDDNKRVRYQIPGWSV